MKSWLVENKEHVSVGISLDGNKIAHDLNRCNSYDMVHQNLPFFRKHWPEQPAKMTISAESIPYVAESVIELEEMGLPFYGNVVFENIWGTSHQKAKLLDTYSEQLNKLVEYYSSRPDRLPPRMLAHDPGVMYRSGQSEPPGEACVRYCGAGHELVIVDIDGNTYSGHRFMPWVTGRPAPSEPVNRQGTWGPERCAKCRIVSLCPTCAGFNWQVNGNPATRTTYHCEAFKLEFLASAKLHAVRLMQQAANLSILSPNQISEEAKLRLDAILDLATNGT